jgi:hypothetical protein
LNGSGPLRTVGTLGDPHAVALRYHPGGQLARLRIIVERSDLIGLKPGLAWLSPRHLGPPHQHEGLDQLWRSRTFSAITGLRGVRPTAGYGEQSSNDDSFSRKIQIRSVLEILVFANG